MPPKSMPLGAAKAAVGRKTKAELAAELEKKREAMSEQMLKNREEFDLNEDKVSFYELASWYGECVERNWGGRVALESWLCTRNDVRALSNNVLPSLKLHSHPSPVYYSSTLHLCRFRLGQFRVLFRGD